jgi:hypothetical protein
MASEMLRVVRPGGVVWLSWTTWLSPWGGHETAPWHYLGGRRAADRYAAKHGRRPKNDFGHSLFACSAGRMVRWAKAQAGPTGPADVLDIRPRYHPDLGAAGSPRSRACARAASWNVVIVLRRRA